MSEDAMDYPEVSELPVASEPASELVSEPTDEPTDDELEAAADADLADELEAGGPPPKVPLTPEEIAERERQRKLSAERLAANCLKIICKYNGCGKIKLHTEAGVILCDNPEHGGVIAMPEGEYKQAARAVLKQRWLDTFPTATKEKRGYSIAGMSGRFKRTKPPYDGPPEDAPKTSVLKSMSDKPDGQLVARCNQKVYFFSAITRLSRSEWVPSEKQLNKEPASA
jgi:hypothetical protein